MNKEAQKRAQKRYEQSGVLVRKLLKFHRVHDADILEYLESQENVNGKIKELIRAEIGREG